MRSRAALSVVLTVFVGVAALLVHAASDDRPLQQVLGVFVQGPVAPLSSGHEVCQGPIGLVDDTSSLIFNPGTPKGEPGPPITATMKASGTQRVLSRGQLANHFDPAKPQRIVLSPPVPDGQVVDVCFTTTGPGRALLFGDGTIGKALLERAGVKGQHPTITTSAASVDGRVLPNRDIAMVFPRTGSESVLSLIPEMFRRAALFRPGWTGTWTFWALALLLVAGVPLMLWRALAQALRHDSE